MNLEIHVLKALTDNYIYALLDDAKNCVVIDPGEALPVLEFLESRQLKLSHILCTHHHLDHVGGVAELLRHALVPVWTSAQDHGRIAHASRIVADSDDLTLLGSPVKVLAVPGHTLGQIAFWLPAENALFVGDTLFSCGCGRLFEGSAEQMFTSLAKIAALPPTTRIYFGHEYTLNNIAFVRSRGAESPELQSYESRCHSLIERGEGTTPGLLGEELRRNPFLYAKSVTEFKEWREARNRW